MNIKAVSANVNFQELLDGKLELYQNVPNPFEHDTEFRFKIAKSGKAIFTVVNLLGEVVFHHEQEYSVGEHNILWNRSIGLKPISSGLYLYKLECNDEEAVKKLIIK